MVAVNERMRVNLNNNVWVWVCAESNKEDVKKWDIDIYSSENIWLGNGVYIPEYSMGLRDCDAQFSDDDYDLIDKALGMMFLEIEKENSIE